MASRSALFARFLTIRGFYRGLTLCCLAGLAVAPLCAKEAGLTAVELFRGANGPGYVLLSGVLINGKDEVRSCASASKIDKSSYGKLPKMILSAGMAIEYGADGVLTLTADKTSTCVVPGNLKFEKGSPETPAELAGRALMDGRIISGTSTSAASLPLWKPGIKIIFVAAPTPELGEYLLAERESTIPLWQGFLAKYPASSHAAQAKEALVALLVADGTKGLEAYQATVKTPTRSYDSLKIGKDRADEALAVVPGDTSATGLQEKVRAEIAALLSEGGTYLQGYRQALASHGSGYMHLVAANALADACTGIDPRSGTVEAFRVEARHEMDTLEAALRAGEADIAAKKFDAAASAVTPYKSFAPEVPRLAAIIDAAYQSHFDQAQKMGSAANWEGAVKEYQIAAQIKPTKEVTAAISDAEAAWEAQKNAKAADDARQKSATFVQDKDFVGAYEVLANLPTAPRALVASDLKQLEPMFLEQAPQMAKAMEKAHDPIRGLADEEAIEQTYGFLEHAYELSNDASLKDRVDDLGDKLSEYYLNEAKRYLDKPEGTGAGVGWRYLEKALRYKASNLDAVRDERTLASAAYQMRSTLSIRVEFRDQTSRRDSSGFAEQLADSIATGLETSGLQVKVIRPNDKTTFDANFQLIGDVVDHTRTKNENTTPKQSHYRAGEQDVPNDAWNKANRDHEAATLELESAQHALEGATVHDKKKEISDAKASVAAAEKKVEEASVKLDAIPKTLPQDIIKPYTYTERRVEQGAVVELRFRIMDFSKSQVGEAVPVKKSAQKVYTVLENVKADDTEGVTNQATIPDELELLTSVENGARDELVNKVKDAVAKLPPVILEQAHKKIQDGDDAGAAESYILYLNSTPEADTTQRREAQQFLQDKFNFKNSPKSGS